MRPLPTFRTLALLASLLPSLRAQGDDPTALAQQADDRAVAALTARAEALTAQKLYGKAVALWRELVQEFAPGEPKAMTALGFVQDGGGAWHRDASKLVPDKDLKGDAKVERKLEQEWDKTQKDLAKGYERAAAALTTAGNPPRAMVCWRRLLRFRPGDQQAAAAMQLLGFDGHTGTAEDLRLLRRGRAIRQAVEYLKQWQVPVLRIEGRDCPVLAAASLPHKGFATEHFEMWGTIPEDKLKLAVQYAERSLLMCRTAFGVVSGEPFRPKRLLSFCWVTDRPAYQKVLDAHKEQWPQPDRLRFLKEDVDLAFVGSGSSYVRLLVNKTGSDEELLDQTVRGVAQDATLFQDVDGLWEGIGHAMCGFFFDRTITFFIEQGRGRTVTSWQPKPLLPDMNAWREMAAEAAWGKNDTPSARLVLLQAFKFTNEERVKAWAMTDYLLRREPTLLQELADSKGKTAADAPSVEAEFRRRTQLGLPDLDADWRDYWGRCQSLRAAMAAPPRGSKEEVAGAKAIAWAINDARNAAHRGPIGYYVTASQDALAVQQYFDALQKAEKEQQKNPKIEVPMPAPPVCLGRSVLAVRGSDVAAALAGWMLLPGARDLLLAPGRSLIGTSQGKQALVLDLAEPAVPTLRGAPLTWPRHGQAGVVASCKVQDLGTLLRDALLAKGRQPGDEVGMPVSLHFHRELTAAQLPSVRCQLYADREEIDGTLVCVQGDGGPAQAAAGCFVCVPDRPLPKNRGIGAEWTLPEGILPKRERFPRVVFTVQGSAQ